MVYLLGSSDATARALVGLGEEDVLRRAAVALVPSVAKLLLHAQSLRNGGEHTCCLATCSSLARPSAAAETRVATRHATSMATSLLVRALE